MEKILIIAQREFTMAIARRAYIFSIIIFPLVILALGALQSINTRQVVLHRSQTIGVIDHASVIDFSIAEKIQRASEIPLTKGDSANPLQIARYEDVKTAVPDFQSRKLDVLYLVPTDYKTRSVVEVYTRDEANPKPTFGRELIAFQNLLRISLLKSQVGAETIDFLLSPTNLTQLVVTENGSITPVRSERENMISWMAPLALIMVLGMWILISSRYMLAAATEEEGNRVMEVMLSIVKPDQLLMGKLIGLSGVAIIHLLFFLVIVGLLKSTFWTFLNLPLTMLLICLVFCVFGYLFFAGLMTAAGMIGLGRSVSFLTFSIWIPLLLADSLSSDPNGTLARVLSYIPWTSTMTMVLRLNLGKVPITDIVTSLVLLIGSAYLTLWGGARVFRVSTLMLGKRVSMAEITRWTRVAWNS